MKETGKENPDDLLLDAVLADESWRGLDLDLRRRARLVLQARHRRRRRLLQGAQIAIMGLCCALAASWWHAGAIRKSATASVPLPVNDAEAQDSARAEFVSEAEMLALFPKGSCVVAEVDGQKQLVFFDARNAREGFLAADLGPSR